MEFGLTHSAFQSEDEAVIEEGGVIETIAVADQSVSDATQIEEAIPIGIIAGEAGNLEAEDYADPTESNFGSETGEAGAVGEASAGKTEILIDEDHLVGCPAEILSALNKSVLARGRFAVILYLGGGGLADIDDGGSLDMSWFDLG